MDTHLEYIGSLTLNSYDRDAGTSLSDAKFAFNNRLVGVDYIAVIGVTMENLQYDIPSGTTFLFTIASTPWSYTFTSVTGGQYTGSALATFLQATIISVSAVATATVTFSSVNNRLTFNTGTVSTMQINLSNFSRQLGMIIDDADTTSAYPASPATSFTLPYPVNIVKTVYFDFRSSLLNKYSRVSASSANAAGKSLHRVINGLGYGSVLIDKPLFPRTIKFDRQEEITNIDIRIHNSDSSLSQLNNSVWSIEIGLYRVRL